MNTTTNSRRGMGVGRLLIAVYGVLALAATGRSFVQIATKFDQASLAYSLSAIAAVVYIVATIALVARATTIAWIAIGFELCGVIVVGTLSLMNPALFPHDTVWSRFGMGYLFIPLLLPLLGMWWLRVQARTR